MKSSLRLALAASFALGLLLVPPFAFGQEIPQPTAEHKSLKVMEGTWEATLKMPDGIAFPGESTMKLECGGLWLVSDYKSEFGGFKFQGKGLDGYDTTKKKFVSVWVDSMSTTPMMLEGTYDETTKTLTMTGTGKGNDGQPTNVKTVSKSPSDDEHIFTMYSIDKEGKESSMFSIEYKRKK